MECKEYTGYIGNAGYGLDYNPETKKTISAHRLSFKLHYGYLPKIVMHICNNKTCINPLHLKDGTQSENILQSYKDGLQINPRRICSKELVLLIYNSKISTRKLAKQYGISQGTVQRIKQGLTYREWTGHGGSCGV